MLIAEELLLLALDPTGRKIIGKDTLVPSLGGALLVELALRERIGVTPHEAGWLERGRVTITSLDPTDDPELDALLTNLAGRERVKVKDLVGDGSGKRITKGLLDRLAARLVAGGVLTEERGAILGLPRWPTRDPRPRQEVVARLEAALLGGSAPTEPTLALISLLSATKQVTKVVAHGPEGTGALKRRARELGEGDWAGKAVKQAIDEVAAASAAAVTAVAAAGSS